MSVTLGDNYVKASSIHQGYWYNCVILTNKCMVGLTLYLMFQTLCIECKQPRTYKEVFSETSNILKEVFHEGKMAQMMHLASFGVGGRDGEKLNIAHV